MQRPWMPAKLPSFARPGRCGCFLRRCASGLKRYVSKRRYGAAALKMCPRDEILRLLGWAVRAVSIDDGQTWNVKLRARPAAPGKLLFNGEYAVLDGARRCVMAGDRRVKSGCSGHLAVRLVECRQLGLTRQPCGSRRLCCAAMARRFSGWTDRFGF